MVIRGVAILVFADHVRALAAGGTTRCEGSGLAPSERIRGLDAPESRCSRCGRWRDLRWLEVGSKT